MLPDNQTESPPKSDGECGKLCLRPLAAGDRDRVQRWLADAGVSRWWGSAASASAKFRMALDSRTAVCRIIELECGTGAEPIGYAQAMETAAAMAELPKGVVPGTWDCDLFIGSSRHRGQGHGQLALDQLVRDVFATTLAVGCSIAVSIRNESAARAYERIGFRWSSIWHDPSVGPCWIMLRGR